jgi:hypothetical protein
MFARLMGLNVISPGKLQQLVQKQPVSILDVNSPQSWLTARVPGARPLSTRWATTRAISQQTEIPRWCSIARISCAERRRTRPVARRTWGTGTST